MAHQTWDNKVDYMLTMLGYCIGVGTMWRFPYICMRNGGGAFLLLFVLFTIIGTIPCVFLELTIGQYAQSGPINVWNLSPAFKGIGVAVVVICFFLGTYYPCLLSWFLYYIYHSFSAELPWTLCGNSWNTDTCVQITAPDNSSLGNITTTTTVASYSILNVTSSNMNSSISGMSAAEEFWKYKVLELSEGLDSVGGLRWELVGCLAIVHLSVFLFIFHGIKVSGKVVYVTVLTPFILTAVFLVRGCLLPGAGDGIYYYVYPKFAKILNIKVWIEACGLALYSLGIGFGANMVLAGHNKFNNNCFRDTMILVFGDLLTTIFTGFAFFAIIGHVAHVRGVSVEHFQASGYNLGFIVYPEAVASLPLPQLWSVFTFVLLLTLGIDSLIPTLEVVITAISEHFPYLRQRRFIPTTLVILTAFLVGTMYLTQGGIYILTLVDWYYSFPSLLVCAILECVVVCWVYGIQRLEKDIETMWGASVPCVLVISMKYTCPALLMILLSYSLYSYHPPEYGDYVYPGWATSVGWMIALASIIPIPTVFMYTVYRIDGNSLFEVETFQEKFYMIFIRVTQEVKHIRMLFQIDSFSLSFDIDISIKR